MPNLARDRAEVAVACHFISGDSSDEECECATPPPLEKLLLQTVLKQREEIDMLQQALFKAQQEVGLVRSTHSMMVDKTVGKRKR
jgi:hypothetical protein